MYKKFCFALLFFFLLNQGYLFAQSRLPDKIRKPTPAASYPTSLYINDGIYFERDILFGKREAPFRNAVKKLEEPERTLAFDADLSPDELLNYLDNPDKLFFENGKAYVLVNDNTHFLTQVEVLGQNSMSPSDLRRQLDKFSSECIGQGINPDLISVDFTEPGVKCVITAFIESKFGRVKVFQRFNFCTVKEGCRFQSICYFSSISKCLRFLAI
jgi:hypothetical protein